MSVRLVTWIAAVAGAALLFVLVNNVGTLCVLVLVVLLPLLSAAVLALQARNLQLQLDLAATGVVGQAEPLGIVALGAGALPLSSVYVALVRENGFANTCERSNLCLVFSRESNRIPVELRFVAPGLVTVRLENCRMTDMFGLFSHEVRVQGQASILVMPELFDVGVQIGSDFDSAFDNDRYSMELAGGDPTETFALREYQPGDPLKSVHWKLSQKTGELIVRELGLPIVEDVLLLYETQSIDAALLPQPRMVDAMAATALSLSHALVSMEVRHALCWQAQCGQPVLVSVEDEGGFRDAARQLLCAHGGLADDSAQTTPSSLVEMVGSCPFAHVVNVSPYLQPNLDVLHNGNRVLSLVFSPEPPVEAESTAVWTSAETFRGDLMHLEI